MSFCVSLTTEKEKMSNDETADNGEAKAENRLLEKWRSAATWCAVTNGDNSMFFISYLMNDLL